MLLFLISLLTLRAFRLTLPGRISWIRDQCVDHGPRFKVPWSTVVGSSVQLSGNGSQDAETMQLSSISRLQAPKSLEHHMVFIVLGGPGRLQVVYNAAGGSCDAKMMISWQSVANPDSLISGRRLLIRTQSGSCMSSRNLARQTRGGGYPRS